MFRSDFLSNQRLLALFICTLLLSMNLSGSSLVHAAAAIPAQPYIKSAELTVDSTLVDSIDDDKDGIPNGIECLGYIGKVPVAVVNGSFEAPDIDKSYSLASKRWGSPPQSAVAYKSAMVEGWSTTATDAEIEIWQSGFSGVPAYRGEQFAEINANQSAALYQDITTTPGSTMHWSFAHRGRTGTDTISLQVGPPQGPYTTLGTFKTGTGGWSVYEGDYLIPAGQSKTRFFYKAVATANGDNTTGNFLDDIQFYTKASCKLDTDGDGIVNSLDLDSDNDGILDIREVGLKDENGDGIIDQAVDLGAAASVPDTDGDRLPDFLDLDADGDGIPDVLEAQLTKSYIAPSGKVDAAGVDVAFAGGLQPIDTDNDSVPDYLDTDSDRDKLTDTVEAKLKLDGRDDDQDGLDREVDGDKKSWGPVQGNIAQPLTTYPNNGTELNYRDNGSISTTVVQTGGNGGLESGPLPGAPSTFIGGIGNEPAGADAATTAVQADQAEALGWHKARLLAEIKLKLDDLMPVEGPNGTTPSPAVPVDVLAVTNAPDAKAVDFVNERGQVQAAVLGILSVGQPYMHDYGVCNRFKNYIFDNIAPIAISVPPANEGWFWHSYAGQGESIREDAILLHIFVNEADKTFHIDSQWTQDAYGNSFDFAFDYVFNLQIWSSELATNAQLLQAILMRLNTYEEGSWQVRYHNEESPTGPTVFVRQVRYAADTVYLDVESLAESDQPVRLYGSWRSHLDRQTLQPFEMQLMVPAGMEAVPLNFPGLLDATIYVESNGFTDKVYSGGGLWFKVAPASGAKSELSLGSCRPLADIDAADLLMAGCATVTTEPTTRLDEVGMGRTLNPNGRPVDVSPYAAVRFWAKGDSTPVRLFLETASIKDGDYYQTIFTPDQEWRQYIIPLTDFAQRGFGQAVGWTGTDVKAVVWVNAEVTGQPLALAIDQVSFTNHALVEANLLTENNGNTSPRLIQMVAPTGAEVSAMTLHYSLDGGRTFVTAPMAGVQAASVNGLYQGELPAQPLGSDIRYYVTATHTNGYLSQIPVDAPHSFYRYRVDDRSSLLVNDFGAGDLKNRLGGGSGLFNNPTSGGQLRAYLFDQQLLLDYAVPEAEQYAGYFTQLPQSDLRAYTTLNLLVRGEVGGEQLLVGMRDTHNFEPRLSVGDLLPGGLITAWQWVQIPLASFSPDLDRAAIETISFSFFNSHTPTSGRVYIREVRFTGLATPVIVDSFDDANLQTNGQGNSYWTAAPNSSLVPTIAAGDATKAGGGALQLDYSVGAGGYATWRSNLNTVAVGADALLTAWVKGGNQSVPPRFYLSDGTRRAAIAVAAYVTLRDDWQLVQVPLSAFTVQGVNVAHLTGFEVVFEHKVGNGTFWLDNVRLGNQGPPQADLRVLHLRNDDNQPLALHLPNGAPWRISSSAPWLFTLPNGAGPATLAIQSVNWKLAPGVYNGNLQIQTAAGQSEAVMVVLTITEPGATTQESFLPLIAR